MAEIKPAEISAILREQLSGFKTEAQLEEVGTVLQIGDGIARIYGLGGVQYGELIEFENGVLGLALNLEQDSVGAVVLGDYLDLVEGQKVVCTGKILEVPVGESLLGRVVNAIGVPIDGKGEIKAESSSPVEVVCISSLNVIFAELVLLAATINPCPGAIFAPEAELYAVYDEPPQPQTV